MKSDAKLLNYVKNSKKTASCFVHILVWWVVALCNRLEKLYSVDKNM